MNFLKNLFGGGGGQSADGGLYFYVQPRGCEEVVEVRINAANDLSLREEGGYFVRKTIRGNYRCFNPAELTLYFDGNKGFQSHEIDGGELVTQEDFDTWQAKLAAKKQAIREHNAAVDAANAADNDTVDAPNTEDNDAT